MVKKIMEKTIGGIPFTAHRAQILPLLIIDFVYFYAYFKLGYVKVDCPAGLGPPALGARKRLG